MGSDTDWLAGGDRRELARAAILRAGREQLLEHGMDKFTAEAVARRAGCSRATLYRIAGGKAALLEALIVQGALDVGAKVSAGIEGLEGEDRLVQAILIGLRELRADRVIHEWVRTTALSDDYFQNSADLAGLAKDWIGAGGRSQVAGEWIVRVFLSLVVWPGVDPAAEENLIREFVGPAFRTS